jgi:hypothetical protein
MDGATAAAKRAQRFPISQEKVIDKPLVDDCTLHTIVQYIACPTKAMGG